MPEEGNATAAARKRPWYARAWQGFNTWRRKRWPFRLLVLLLIFAWPVGERLGGRWGNGSG